MELLEREAPLEVLQLAFERVRKCGQGECVLAYGEAGIGKTSLVRKFAGTLVADSARADSAGATTAQLWMASCEALHTPRPLGPVVDLADRFPAAVADMLHVGRTDNGLFPALLGVMRQSAVPTVLVIEDMHWADAATLDFVRYLGRRLHDVPALILLTYRSDELAIAHPLRAVLGQLRAPTTSRLELAPLSRAAVTVLAHRTGYSAEQVFAATAGNSFYVSEVLAMPVTGSALGNAVPPSVADAVLARLAGLTGEARQVAERVSLFPREVEAELLHASVDASPDAFDECMRKGLLVARGSALAFRHELAREAVYQSIAPFRRRQMHAEVFRALQARDQSAEPGALADLARQVHHAEGAGLVSEVARLAPRSARYAASNRAHREAALLYALAVRHTPDAAQAERAALMEAQALESALAGLQREAIAIREEALQMRRVLGDRRGEGINLRWLARLHGWGDSIAAALAYARQAVDVLETVLPHDAELAIAYCTLSHINLVGERMSEVEIWGQKAIALAEAVGDVPARCQAMACVGISTLRFADVPAAWLLLEDALELAVANRLDSEAAFGFELMHVLLLAQRKYARARQHAQRGIEFCEARGIDVFAARIRLRRSYAHMQTGDFQAAADDLAIVRERHTLPAMEQAVFDFLQALLALRCGARDAAHTLTLAIDAMRAGAVSIWFTSPEAAMAECAWLGGDSTAPATFLQPALAHALAVGDHWRASELAAWWVRLWGKEQLRAAFPHLEQRTLCGPFALEVAGDVCGAERAWADCGALYERAMALACGDEAARRQALEQFTALGAIAAADAVRRNLRELGARGVQRGPLPRTKVDPFGLTLRERAVFELLQHGLSNVDIATRMHRSQRTVEHHVAAVFAKLAVHSRAELLARFGLRAGPQGAGSESDQEAKNR